MAKIERKARKNDRHEKILQHASKLFNQKGYHCVTIDDIAKSLGSSKFSIYYYFERKQDLLYFINDLAHTRVIQRFEQIAASNDPPDTKSLLAITNHIDVVLSEISPVTSAFREKGTLSKRERQKLINKRDQVDRLYREIILEGIAKRVFIDCDSKLASFVIIGALSHMLHWYSPSGPLSKEALASFFADFLIRGLLRETSSIKSFGSKVKK